MKKRTDGQRMPDRDTLRRHYDFSKGVRGATVARYAQGVRVVIIGKQKERG